ncbi:MAG TPA: tetratricopeptide repeat protein [Chloroflexia bacterium]|nr:tetratricopeptide repeat protein [Chloroflexia bacterium]
MDEQNAAQPAPASGLAPADPSTAMAVRLREGITALRQGDRDGAYAIFRDITAVAPENQNAWIGMALSSPILAEAAAALHTAERLDPTSRFVVQAESDLTRRLPGFTEALAAERARPAPPLGALATDLAAAPAEPPTLSTGPRLVGGQALAAPTDSRARRILLSLGVGVAGLVLIGLLGLGLVNTINRPIPATLTPIPPSATPVPPSSTPVPTLAPPQVHVPPALAVTPGGDRALNPLAQATAVPSPPPSQAAIDRQAAIEAVRAGRYAAAIPALEIASERKPGDAEALYYLGIAYLNTPDRPHAAEDAALTFRSVAALQPHWAPGLDMLARSLIAQSQFRDAVPPAHQAVESDPNRAEYWLTLGRAYEGAGATAEAQKAYDEAAHLSPTPLGGTPPPPPSPSPTAPPGAGPTTPSPTATPPASALPSPSPAAATQTATPAAPAIGVTETPVPPPLPSAPPQ